MTRLSMAMTLLLAANAAPAWGQTAEETPDAAQAQAAPRSDQPMEVKLLSIWDERRIYHGPEFADTPRTPGQFRLELAVAGSRVGEVVRIGQPILQEMVDDQGRELVDPKQFNAAMQAETKRVDIPQMWAQRGLLPIQVGVPNPPRDSKKIARLRGFINITYGSGNSKVIVDRLPHWFGKEIDDPALREAGLRVTLLPPEELRQVEGNPSFGLIFHEGAERVNVVNSYDAWWRFSPLLASDGPGLVRGEPYRTYRPMRNAFSPDSEILFVLYENVENETLLFELIDVDLP